MSRPTTDNTSPQAIFKRAVRGANFMTPAVIEYGKCGSNYVYELASGFGMRGEKIFGVTIVSYQGNSAEHEHNLSKMFYSKAEANKYINSLL